MYTFSIFSLNILIFFFFYCFFNLIILPEAALHHQTAVSPSDFDPFYISIFVPPHTFFLSLFLFLHWSILSKLLIQGSSWWWSSFFHCLFPSGWRLLSPLLLCLPLHLHGEKSPLKDLIEAQRSSLHRSPTSKFPSSGNQSTRASSRCSLKLH